MIKITILPTPFKVFMMENEFRDRQRRNYNTMRNVYNITMGILILGIGLLMFFSDKVGLSLFEQFDKTMIYAFGGLCLLYGGFRLYRGIKKED
jgi:threonine/homoserine/homoserine lactone efflux protein